MKCNTHHIEYGGPFCPQCVRDMHLSSQGGVSVDEIRRIVREELARVLPVQQTCVHPFNRLGIDADGVMWCVECLTKPLVIPVPFGASDNQS